ncbi:MAG: sigma-54-dependent Fis family transcriptional regulator [Alphaproteobacteria bacterium]|nr:sigma-54-dependent Fis family transcriptional regulator [Alphaproteobacteria bacterium]
MSAAIKRLPVASSQRPAAEPATDVKLIGNSPPILKVLQTVRQVAPSKATVFITGESGTGKEVCAEMIHRLSERAEKPFVPVNCGAIPRDLIESELFGHLKGSFTGAVCDREGAAALAHGGTLFLDEICELEAGLQTRLLRFLQTGLIQPVGASTQRAVDIRVVCATNRDPRLEVAEGRLRKDLFYRLHVIPIEMPGLAMRGADVISLAGHFLAMYSAEEGKVFNGLSSDVQNCLCTYGWPGNVRELQNAVRQIVVLNDGPQVEMHMLPDDLSPQCQNVVPFGNADGPVTQRTAEPELWMIEREAIEQAIRACGGSIPQAARQLGVSPSTIYRKKEAWLTGGA